MATPQITIPIKVSPKAQQALFTMGKERGFQPSAYAQLLFDAAFATRVGIARDMPVSDAELDEMVRATLCLAGEFSTAAIAKRLGISEPLVTRILDGWRKQKGLN